MGKWKDLLGEEAEMDEEFGREEDPDDGWHTVYPKPPTPVTDEMIDEYQRLQRVRNNLHIRCLNANGNELVRLQMDLQAADMNLKKWVIVHSYLED